MSISLARYVRSASAAFVGIAIAVVTLGSIATPAEAQRYRTISSWYGSEWSYAYASFPNCFYSPTSAYYDCRTGRSSPLN
jgi:hypothetical protein